jgi:hypothetical protein
MLSTSNAFLYALRIKKIMNNFNGNFGSGCRKLMELFLEQHPDVSNTKNNEDQLKQIITVKNSSWDRAVGTTTGYGLDDQRLTVRVPIRGPFSPLPGCPHRLRGLSYPTGTSGSLRLNGRGGESGRQTDRTPRTTVKMKNIDLPTCLNCVVLNEISTRITLS